MCAQLACLPDVNGFGIDLNVPIRVHVEKIGERPSCAGSGATARVKERPVAFLIRSVDPAAAEQARRACERSRLVHCSDSPGLELLDPVKTGLAQSFWISVVVLVDCHRWEAIHNPADMNAISVHHL